MEGADAEESAFDTGVAFIGLSDLVRVAAQSDTGRTRLFGNCLADGCDTRAHDR